MDVPNEIRTDKKPWTWAVVVVHGVGDSGPGRTLDAFLRTILRHPKFRLREIEPPRVHMLPEPDPVLPDCDGPIIPTAPTDSIPIKNRFPMHLREARIIGPRDTDPERVIFAEV